MLVLLGMVFWGGGVFAACSSDVVDIKTSQGAVRFSVEVVDTDAGRNQGLMFRESMGRFSGMLFVYDREQPVAFWMKNTILPLDMIFLDGRGVVTRVHANAVPHDLSSIFGGNKIQYVLEINAGLAAEFGIKAGSKLRHPAVENARAAWSC